MLPRKRKQNNLSIALTTPKRTKSSIVLPTIPPEKTRQLATPREHYQLTPTDEKKERRKTKF